MTLYLPGLQANDKSSTAEFDDIICHYLFALADLFGSVDHYLTIGNQHFCLSPGTGHPFEFKNLKKLDRLFFQNYFFHDGHRIACLWVDFDWLLRVSSRHSQIRLIQSYQPALAMHNHFSFVL